MKTFSILSVLLGITGLLLFGVPVGDVWADGTEVLGPPSIPISQGTNVVAAGVGLAQSQPDDIVITVPVGAAVTQVLLYWEGFMATDVPGDEFITVNGNSVTGTLIGGQAFFFSGAYSSAFRADITSLGLVGPGTNTLTVGDLVFSDVTNGAGVVVIYDDGSDITDIDIRDGLDLAFINFSEPRKSTIAQTFTFSPSPVDRVGTLAMFFSSVSGTASSGGPLRPSSIEVTVDGTTTTFSNQLDSNDGQEWDTVNASVTIPAGASSLTVQAFSRDDFGNGQNPLAASFVWTAAAFSIQGCSIGDYVWEDANRDGCQDDEERGINGVTVELYENCDFEGVPETFETITEDGQDGFYEFKNLVCGQNYGIRFVDNPDDIYVQTDPNSCFDDPNNPNNNNDTTDSDCGDEGRVCATAGDENATPGSDNPTIDCGYVCEGEIGDFVWLDTNGSPGCQDPDEPGIDGITVNLYKVEGCPEITEDTPIFDTKETTNGGEYSFTGLCPGDYRVKFVDPEGRDNTTENVDCEAFGLPDSGTKDSDCGGDGECVTLPMDDGNPVDDTIDCGKVPPCLLGVEKFCSEPPPPLADLECDAKIAATTLRYIGPDISNATVVFSGKNKKAGAGATYENVDLVSGVTVLTSPAENGFTIDERPEDLGSKMTISIDGVEEVIHTSCSTPYVAGLPAPLDNPKGDPSPNWFVVNFVDKEGAFAGIPDPQEPALFEECTVFLGPVPSCDTTGKPETLTWRFDGGSDPLGECAGSTFATIVNEKGKLHKDFECLGAVDPTQSVTVKPDKGDSFDVAPGEEFTISLKASKEIVLSQNGAMQELEFHTSCSQPIEAGATAGALTLVALDDNRAGKRVDYTYKVTNTGVFDREVKLVDTVDGVSVFGPEVFNVPMGKVIVKQSSATITETTTNTVRVTDVDDDECFAEDSVTVNVEEPPIPPGSCEDGKPTALVFEYTGEGCSATTNLQEGKFKCEETGALGDLVGVEMTKDANKISVEISGNEVIIFYDDPEGDKFPSEIKYKITGSTGNGNTQTQALHTSCSKPLEVGDQFGALNLKEFIPED